MQATLLIRSKTTPDIAPRRALAISASQPDATARAEPADASQKETFAAQLSAAKTSREKRDAASPSAAEKPSDAAAKPSAGPVKPVEKPEPRSDAAADTDGSDGSADAHPQNKAEGKSVAESATKTVEDASADQLRKVPVSSKSSKTVKAEPDATEAASANVQPPTLPASPAPEDGDKTDQATSVTNDRTIAATAVSTTQPDAAATPTQSPAQAADVNASASAPPSDVAPSSKLKAKVEIDAKPADAKPTQPAEDPAAVAPRASQSDRPSRGDADAHENASGPAKPATDLPDASAKKAAESTFDTLLSNLATADRTSTQPTPVASHALPLPTATPEQRFAADNVENVVKSVHSQIESGGNGQMRIRLDPPELGALEVAVKMIDGRMSASFTTSNDQATQLLSHNLNNLKSSLEASGISVDRIQVRQTSASDNAQQQPSNGEHRRDGSNPFDHPSQRGDQQRREAVQKMWRKLAYGSDELDFVA